jgi:hypothetical protein
MNIFSHNLTGEQVEDTYATREAAVAAGFLPGQLAVVQDWNHMGIFKFGQNKQGGALALGDVLKAYTNSGLNFRHTGATYTAEGTSGGPELTLTQGNVATAVAKNEYAGMALACTVGNGVGQLNRIRSNDAATTSQTLKLYLARPFPTALHATTDDIQLLNFNLVEKTDAALNSVSGVVIGDVTDDYYFWRQIAGVCFVKEQTGSGFTDGDDTRVIVASSTAGVAIVGAADQEYDAMTLGFGEIISKIGTSAADLALCKIFCATEFGIC